MAKDTGFLACPSRVFHTETEPEYMEVRMILGTITINTCYGRATLPVEVLGKGPRPATAWVQALDGLEPFTKFSHGGPFQSSTEVFQLAAIHDIHVQVEPDQEEEVYALELVNLQAVGGQR